MMKQDKPELQVITGGRKILEANLLKSIFTGTFDQSKSDRLLPCGDLALVTDQQTKEDER